MGTCSVPGTVWRCAHVLILTLTLLCSYHSLHLADKDTEAQMVGGLLMVALLVVGTAKAWAQAARLESMPWMHGCSKPGREAGAWSAFAHTVADSVPSRQLSWPTVPTPGTWQGLSINFAVFESFSPVRLALRKEEDETSKYRLSPMRCAQLWPHPPLCRLSPRALRVPLRWHMEGFSF